MREDTVVQLRQPGSFEDDPLTEVLRLGARRLLGQAVAAEVAGFVEAYAHLTDSAGRRRIVRHGHLPEREIQTGIGPVAVRCPRVRDRGAGETGPRVRFTSRILPPYLRRAKSIEELLPWLYLKGISTGDFCAALAALLGPEAPGLSASTIARLKEVWQGELEHWQRRDLSAEHWKHIRTTNPIESTFATVRLRTTKTKGCLSRMTALTMVFKLCQSASKKWRRLDGSHQIADIIQGVKFKDGEKLTERAA